MSVRVHAAIGLGSNLGDREATIRSALAAMDAIPGLRLIRVSRIIETEPVGPVPQDPFLNATAVVQTSLPPRRLLDALLSIERRHGRDRATGERHGPRTLDLDLLLYADQVIDEPGLQVPHPAMASRAFVLEPLSEIAPEWVHPALQASVESLRLRTAAEPVVAVR